MTPPMLPWIETPVARGINERRGEKTKEGGRKDEEEERGK
jgi:hypothetical protein